MAEDKCNTPSPSRSIQQLTISSAVAPEVEASYSVIIDVILQSSDLNTISAKAIRKGLQAKVDHDISGQKVPYRSLATTEGRSCKMP
jgi:hypothetical protein